MQAFLKKHAPSHAHHTVKINWQRADREVVLEFQVNKRDSSSWLADEKYTQDYKENWGLWEQDVVEGFLQLRSHPDDVNAPYLEVQVSPLNQPFALVIIEPRKTFHPPQKLSFTHEVQVENRSWRAVMKIQLPDDLKGESLYGGFFACLGHEPREFFALEPNPEPNPDFHRPELFIGLDQV